MTMIGDRYQLADRLGSGAMGDVYRATDNQTGDSDHHMGRIISQSGVIVGNTPAHTQQPNLHLAQAHQPEPRGHQPEMQLTQGFIHPFSCYLGEPVIQAGKEGKYKASEHGVVEMTDDEICVMQVQVG